MFVKVKREQMKQIYHSNVTTNVRLRTEINNSTWSNSLLSLKHNVSEKTVIKWKNRTTLKDKSSRSDRIKYALYHYEIFFGLI